VDTVVPGDGLQSPVVVEGPVMQRAAIVTFPRPSYVSKIRKASEKNQSVTTVDTVESVILGAEYKFLLAFLNFKDTERRISAD
jgi:hypothetical protein